MISYKQGDRMEGEKQAVLNFSPYAFLQAVSNVRVIN
jgi:hypothetical protein